MREYRIKKYCLKKKSYNEEVEKRIDTTQEKEEQIIGMLMKGNVSKQDIAETFGVSFLHVLQLNVEVETKRRIIELLDEGKLEQKDIAETLGVSVLYVSRVKVKLEKERMRRMKLVWGDTEDKAEDCPDTEEVEEVQHKK
jgi:DNA-directed RNA polymerase specialized sigma subunit